MPGLDYNCDHCGAEQVRAQLCDGCFLRLTQLIREGKDDEFILNEWRLQYNHSRDNEDE